MICVDLTPIRNVQLILLDGQIYMPFVFIILESGNISQADTISNWVIHSGKTEAITFHKKCPHKSTFTQTLIVASSTLSFLTVAPQEDFTNRFWFYNAR